MHSLTEVLLGWRPRSKWMCPNSHYECLALVPRCAFYRKQSRRMPTVNCCESWWDLSFIQFPDCKVIALGLHHFPFSLYTLSPEWIYVVPYSAHITMFVKIMNSLKVWISNKVNELWKCVLKYFLILLTHPTGLTLPFLKSLTLARKRSKRSAKQRLEYWKGQCDVASSLIWTTY